MFLAIGLLLIWGVAHAEDRSGWYVGMDNYYFRSYDARVLWSHTDLPLECDQWFPGHLELNDGRCRPSDQVFVDPPQNFHSNGLMPGLHAGYQWSYLRLELEYFFREHHGYEGVAPFYRSGSYLDVLGYDLTDEWLRGQSKEFRFSAERIAEVWAHCGFTTLYFDAEGLVEALVPYAGAGIGYGYQHVYYWAVLQRAHDREALAELGESPAAAGTLTLEYDDLFDHGWAYQLVAGLDWKMREGLRLGLKVAMMDMPQEFEDSASFWLLRDHGAHLEPGPRPEWEKPVGYTLHLDEWRAWRFALNVKGRF